MDMFTYPERTSLWLAEFFLVGQGFIPCRRIFLSAWRKTVPYIKPIFVSARQEPSPPIDIKVSWGKPLACRTSADIKV